jgi:hypothetical protein
VNTEGKSLGCVKCSIAIEGLASPRKGGLLEKVDFNAYLVGLRKDHLRCHIGKHLKLRSSVCVLTWPATWMLFRRQAWHSGGCRLQPAGKRT